VCSGTECGEWCTLGCATEGHAEEAELDFELGAACDLTDTDCESCQ